MDSEASGIAAIAIVLCIAGYYGFTACVDVYQISLEKSSEVVGKAAKDQQLTNMRQMINDIEKKLGMEETDWEAVQWKKK